MEEKLCSSCKKKIVNDNGCVSFNCPKCSNYQIIRCGNCRSNAAKYHCPNCQFEGPN